MIEHLRDLIIFSIMALSPIPLCLLFLFQEVNAKSRDRNKNFRVSLSHSYLETIVLWSAIQVCICLVLGIAGEFNLIHVIGLELVLGVTGSIMLFYLTKNNNIKFYIYSCFLRLDAPLNHLEKLTLSSFAFVGIILLERLTTRPIIDFDSMWYHLPNIANWYQTSSFMMMDKTGDIVFDQALRYPYNWEVLSAFFLMPFQDDFLISFSKLISWSILGISIYSLSIQFGASRLPAIAGSSLMLSIPFLLFDMNTLRIDIPLAAFFVSGSYFAFSCLTYRTSYDFFMLLVSLAMLSGIKTSAIFYCALIIVLFLIIQVLDFPLRETNNSSNRPVSRYKLIPYLQLLAIFIIILIGGFWYIRNWIEIGNPLGYVQVKIGNFTLFLGAISALDIKGTSLSNIFEITNLSQWKTIGIQALVRLQIPFVVMVLQVLFLPWALLTRKSSINAKKSIGLGLLLIGTAWLYWNTPSSGSPGLGEGEEITAFVGQGFRYGFPFIAILGITAAVSATTIGTKDKVVVTIVVISNIICLVNSTISEIIKTATFTGTSTNGWASLILENLLNSPSESIGLVFNILGNGFIPIVVYIILYIGMISLLYWEFYINSKNANLLGRLWILYRQLSRLTIILIFAMILISISFVARERRDVLRREIYSGIYDYIETNITKEETMGYLLSKRSYLFYGKHFDRKVVYVAPKISDSLSGWVENLQKQNINVVAIGPVSPVDQLKSSREIGWLEDADSPFIRVFGDDFSKNPLIYRLKNR